MDIRTYSMIGMTDGHTVSDSLNRELYPQVVDGTVALDDAEDVIARWSAGFYELTRDILKPADQPSRRIVEGNRSKLEVTVTTSRVILRVPEWTKDLGGFARLGAALADREDASRTAVVGHAPLECLYNVQAVERRVGSAITMKFFVGDGELQSARFQLTAAAPREHVSRFVDAIRHALVNRWSAHPLDEPVLEVLRAQDVTVSGTRRTRELSYLCPLRTWHGALDVVSAGDNELPKFAHRFTSPIGVGSGDLGNGLAIADGQDVVAYELDELDADDRTRICQMLGDEGIVFTIDADGTTLLVEGDLAVVEDIIAAVGDISEG